MVFDVSFGWNDDGKRKKWNRISSDVEHDRWWAQRMATWVGQRSCQLAITYHNLTLACWRCSCGWKVDLGRSRLKDAIIQIAFLPRPSTLDPILQSIHQFQTIVYLSISSSSNHVTICHHQHTSKCINASESHWNRSNERETMRQSAIQHTKAKPSTAQHSIKHTIHAHNIHTVNRCCHNEVSVLIIFIIILSSLNVPSNKRH